MRVLKNYTYIIIITASIRADDDLSTRRYRLQYITRGRPLSTVNIIIRTGWLGDLYMYIILYNNINNSYVANTSRRAYYHRHRRRPIIFFIHTRIVYN